MYTPRELKEFYNQGKNIMALIKADEDSSINTTDSIEIAYDLQSGSYIKALEDQAFANVNKQHTEAIAKYIKSLCQPESVLEAGIGEAITFAGVLNHLDSNIKKFGFDINWSRVATGLQWLEEKNIQDATLCTGDLLHIPFADNSIDVVYTSHSIEPNGGNEEPIIKELYRITKKYLVLIEPSFELGSNEQKQRMIKHGYCKNLFGISEALGYSVIQHELFPVVIQADNRCSIVIIEKNTKDQTENVLSHYMACPKFKTELEDLGDVMYSPEALSVYPIIGGIPCLRIENAIIAGKYKSIYNR